MKELTPISSAVEYQARLDRFLKPRLKFHDYLRVRPPKTYINISFAVHYLVHSMKRATYEALLSLRRFYPDVPVRLISDAGEDFSDLGEIFGCAYIREKENIYKKGEMNPFKFMDRLAVTCHQYPEVDWILLMEDDVRIRDRISHWPDAHIAGPSGPRFDSRTVKFLLNRHPGLEINGYNGCGGCIFHRATFLKCYASLQGIASIRDSLDSRISHHTDATLSFMFLYNGFICRRWLDHSEEACGALGPASAVDHQHKQFYGCPMVPITPMLQGIRS